MFFSSVGWPFQPLLHLLQKKLRLHKGFVFFSAQKRNHSKNMKNIWISIKRRLGCFFQAPRLKKGLLCLSLKSQKKNPSKTQVKISSSARFGVLVLCSWPQIRSAFLDSYEFCVKFCPDTMKMPRQSSSPCCWWRPCVTPSASLVSGLWKPKFCTKKMVESERFDWHFLVCFHEEKDYKVAKMGLRDSFAEELYLGLGDIFNMVESFEWKFQRCFKSSEMLKMNLRLLTVLKVNETLLKCSHLLARVFYDLTRDIWSCYVAPFQAAHREVHCVDSATHPGSSASPKQITVLKSVEVLR